MQNGIAEVRVSATLDSQIQGHTSANQYGQVSASAGFTVDQDTRGAVITCTLAPTYRREVVNGQPQRVLNEPDNIGTMYGDTLAPICISPITNLVVEYTANWFGMWGNDSYYHWYSSLTGEARDGAWMPEDPRGFRIVYRATDQFNYPMVVPGHTDHIHLRLVDSADGANLTANYHMRFHEVYEDWWEDAQYLLTHLHPRPLATNPEDWRYLCVLDNETSEAQKRNLKLEESVAVQVTETGSVGGAVPSGRGAEVFKAQTGISIGVTKSVTFSREDQVTVPPFKRIAVFGAISWAERQGKCSKWDMQGYVGDVQWNGISSSAEKSIGYIELTVPPPPPVPD